MTYFLRNTDGESVPIQFPQGGTLEEYLTKGVLLAEKKGETYIAMKSDQIVSAGEDRCFETFMVRTD